MAHSAADWVTIARFPLAAGVAVTAVVGGPSSRVLVVVLAVLAALTDVADGWLARHLASATPRGAALDSVADGVLAVALLVALLELVPPGEWHAWMIVWVLVILVIRVAAGLKARRHEAVVIGHGVLNKVAGATAFVAFVWAVWCGSFSVPLTAVALCVATFAALAEAGSRA